MCCPAHQAASSKNHPPPPIALEAFCLAKAAIIVFLHLLLRLRHFLFSLACLIVAPCFCRMCAAAAVVMCVCVCLFVWVSWCTGVLVTCASHRLHIVCPRHTAHSQCLWSCNFSPWQTYEHFMQTTANFWPQLSKLLSGNVL